MKEPFLINVRGYKSTVFLRQDSVMCAISDKNNRDKLLRTKFYRKKIIEIYQIHFSESVAYNDIGTPESCKKNL